MNTEALLKLSDELSAYARSLDGVTRETEIRPIKKGGRKKAGAEGNGSVEKGVSITIYQTVAGIEMVTSDDFKPGGMVTPDIALRAAHSNLDKTLVGLVNGSGGA